MQGQWRGDVPPYITSNFPSQEVVGLVPGDAINLIHNLQLEFAFFHNLIIKILQPLFQKLFYHNNCHLCTFLSIWLDLFFIFDTFFKIAILSNFDATHETSKMDIESTVVIPTKDSLPLWEHCITARKCSIDC